MDSPSELLGFLSFDGNKWIKPFMKYLDFKETEKIQKGIPLDWPDKIGVAKWDVSVTPLYEYLKEKDLLKSDNENEFFIICRSSVLTFLFYKHYQKELQFVRNGNIITIEEILSDEDRVDSLKDRERKDLGAIAETHLVELANGQKIEVHGAKDTYTMSRKRIIYADGTIINLFISKEIDALYKKGQELIPLDLKLCVKSGMTTPEKYAENKREAIYADYITGGITYVIAIQNQKGEHPKKITVIEDISKLCPSGHLNLFKSEFPKFLRSLTRQNVNSGTILKEVINRNTEFDISIKIKTPVSSEHELVVLGTYKTPFGHKKFINTDFIKMDHFKKKFFKEFLVEPDKILFYGTVKEYAEVIRFLTSEQMAITSRVVGSSE